MSRNSLEDRARQWSRTAWAMTAVFGSLPIASRLFLGSWGFEGSAEFACLCALLAIYLTVRSRRLRALPDPATMLDEAAHLASSGRVDRAIARLSRAIELSPQLWQAYQYRGELRLRSPETIAAAAEDFSAAIRLAPAEAHLYVLRGKALSLLGDEELARQDANTVARLRGVL
jgi:tetratricopeptide (TPR) repeat protein